MKPYTKRELEAIRSLQEAEDAPVDEMVKEKLSEEEIQQMMMEAMMAEMGDGEEDIQAELEESFIMRTLTGRGCRKIHGFSTPKHIFW